MQSREGKPWLLDEYVVVGDLWLRRGRAVGTGTAEVREIAALLGRTPASISRRIGNFKGTDEPGTGLKPITGEALRLWESIRHDPDLLATRLDEARRRLGLLSRGVQDVEGGSVRIVPPEVPSTETVEVAAHDGERRARQLEAVLREQFRQWRDPRGQRLSGIEIDVSDGKLRVDLFDEFTNVLIEVKARADRNHLRLAVGQLYDYRRYLAFPVDLAVLVPTHPSADLMKLLEAADIGAIWPEGHTFADSEDGRLLRTP
ncbi:hypothetical protein [Catenuloplanes atrovinosus]|uniref:Uncharacterized protein n=1 Tax=Catenuloplanes atrovinosus TaxID=137266 RepID=A0AAE3YW39_9ACTN|nr:hypothetical protein [Catenuloplanes atrovinosus]MDR7279066.1 hypothetical protein [Catenuloplanes atrovinosus]